MAKLHKKIQGKMNNLLGISTSELSATWLNEIEQRSRMLLISLLATRKTGKWSAKTNLSRTHSSAYLLLEFILLKCLQHN
jgi:hypothetical protein